MVMFPLMVVFASTKHHDWVQMASSSGRSAEEKDVSVLVEVEHSGSLEELQRFGCQAGSLFGGEEGGEILNSLK